MSAIHAKRLNKKQVTRRCKESELIPVAGESVFDPRLFLGLGQERFEHALALCIDTDDSLHNLQAVDVVGVGSFAVIEGALRSMLQKRKKKTPEARDICYVHNFKDPQRPLPIQLKKGHAKEFRQRILLLLEQLKKIVPEHMYSPATEEKRFLIRRKHEQWMAEVYKPEAEKVAAKHRFSLTPQMEFMPTGALVNELKGETVSEPGKDEIVPGNVIELLGYEFGMQLMRRYQLLLQDMDALSRDSRARTIDRDAEIEAYDQKMAGEIIGVVFDKLPKRNEDSSFQDELRKYAIASYRIFLPSKDRLRTPWETQDNPFLPWEVHVFLDHSETSGPPIVASSITKLEDAVGMIGRKMTFPFMAASSHLDLSHGRLHEAAGGFLIVNAREAASVPGLWQVLKNVIKNGRIPVGEMPFTTGFEMLRPEPINASVRVVMFGPAWLFYLFESVDDEFAGLFKIRGEILTKVERTPRQVRAYASWLKSTAGEINPGAICALIEYAQRLAGDHDHISTNLDAIQTVLQEAAAQVENKRAGHSQITRKHINTAIQKKKWRAGVLQQRRHEGIRSGSLLVSTSGSEIGQVNGLVVVGFDSVEKQIEAFCRSASNPFNFAEGALSRVRLESSEFFGGECASTLFGFPTRITARATPGKLEVVNIHNAVKLAGPLFQKADLTVQGLLRSLYGNDMALYACMAYAFEQTSASIDGDSASLQQFGSLTSAIGKIPMRQSIATTGSLSLHGHIQPIGGVNEKIEGWFDVCQLGSSLTGEQGVIIPHQNVANLMLREDIVQAVSDRKFSIWPVKTLDEYVSTQSGISADKYHSLVREGFKELAAKTKKFNAPPKSK